MSENTLKEINSENIKIGLAGIDIEIPTKPLKDLASKIGTSVFSSLISKSYVEYKISTLTEKIHTEIGELSDLIDVSLRNYAQKNVFSKDELNQVNQVLEWDKENPSSSQFPEFFVHPAERRTQYLWAGLERKAVIASPLKSFGDFLSEDERLRDAIFYKANKTWESIDKIRSTILSHTEKITKPYLKNKDQEEVLWDYIAPQAKHLAERFMLLTDHPWSTTHAYNETATVFGQAARKESWLVEKWKTAAKSKKIDQLNRGFDETASFDEIEKWSDWLSKVPGKQAIVALKENKEAWDEGYSVAMALIKQGAVGEFKEWWKSLKQFKKEQGEAIDINREHSLLGDVMNWQESKNNYPNQKNEYFLKNGRTLIDQALIATPKVTKKQMIEALIDLGGTMNLYERSGKTETSVLIENMGVRNQEEAANWIEWLKKRTTGPMIAMNESGRNEIAESLKEHKLEWVSALLDLRKSSDEPIQSDGKTFGKIWEEYKIKKHDVIAQFSNQSRLSAIEKLNLAAQEEPNIIISKKADAKVFEASEELSKRLREMGHLQKPRSLLKK